MLLVLLAVAGSSLLQAALAQQDQLMSGTWRGPWYRGMTSGVVTLEVGANGAGTIQFTNLENFGDQPVALRNVEISGNTLTFSASGTSGADFTASAKISADGSKMRGNARYEGFGVRFEARPQMN